MDKKVACVIISCFALANAGLVPIQSAKFLEGPSTRTKVVGPDGSLIDAYAPGGRIILEANAGPLIQPAPLVVAQAAIPEPNIFSGQEFQQLVLTEPVANSVEAVAPAVDTVSLEAAKIARVSEDGQRIFLHPGTPERVETRESVPITEKTEESTAGTTELPSTTEAGEADLSGAYNPDNFEKLFDDGSYRPEHF